MVFVGRRAHRLILVLLLLNASMGLLLWRRAVTSLPGARSTFIPYTPTQRLVVTVSLVDTRIRSYPNYPATFDDTSLGSPTEVWVHVWTQDTRRQTFMNYLLVMVPLRGLGLVLLFGVNVPLLLLAIVLRYEHRVHGSQFQHGRLS